MSDNLGLGQIITTPQQRDAIHIAVMPVVAGMDLRPGDHVGLVDGSTEQVTKYPNDPKRHIGVVDPFLTHFPDEGERFWLFLYHGTITSLRHEWTHPQIPTEAHVSVDAAASEQWLRDFAERSDCPGYFDLMAAASNFCDGDTGWSEEYLHFDGRDAHGEIPPEFWLHFEAVTGKRPQGAKPTLFSCSC